MITMTNRKKLAIKTYVRSCKKKSKGFLNAQTLVKVIPMIKTENYPRKLILKIFHLKD